jgi:hypothetical protein
MEPRFFSLTCQGICSYQLFTLEHGFMEGQNVISVRYNPGDLSLLIAGLCTEFECP